MVAVPPQPVAKRPPKIGLALGGGAARGFAHVGVIQVLEEAGLRPGPRGGHIRRQPGGGTLRQRPHGRPAAEGGADMEEAAFTDWTLPIFSRGMLRGEALARYVNAHVGGKLIEHMPLPLGIVPPT